MEELTAAIYVAQILRVILWYLGVATANHPLVEAFHIFSRNSLIISYCIIHNYGFNVGKFGNSILEIVISPNFTMPSFSERQTNLKILMIDTQVMQRYYDLINPS